LIRKRWKLKTAAAIITIIPTTAIPITTAMENVRFLI
jgi:hypothetical protein